MTELLRNLSKELEIHFECNESTEQLQSNLSVLAEQLQLLITTINHNRYVRDSSSVHLPDIGIARKIALVECLAREATQLYRNSEADALTNLALDKEIRRRRRVLRKIKRTHPGPGISWTLPHSDEVSNSRRSSKHSLRLSPIRESIPLPPPTPSVRFRFNQRISESSSHNSSFSSLDTDEPLEFDLV